MSDTDVAITIALLKEQHFPVDITDEKDNHGRRFHCLCGYTGADTKLDPALTRDEWLKHFSQALRVE